ncbi:hypothetical protein F3Y22_tig00111061pilonHSYRG00022 [Hibiscus syriacus]|uniref:Uncharacterized protein n=1 Tax=Hibiscus syriacus TaxID=106335 RepID=A0A6A2Z4C0_HIBSY|nr:hypothetical protein F3Y22_tig00111061pilonHSYRG00022 [Hibiscus syriacus]
MMDGLERLAVAREITSGGSLGSGVTGEDHARLGKLNSQRRLAGWLMIFALQIVKWRMHLFQRLISTILSNLDSLFRKELALSGSLITELESLQSTLTTIQAVLHDAEEKQWKSEAIRNWLAKLEQSAYDLEDLLGGFETEVRGLGNKRNWMPLPGRKASSTCECVGETEFERNEDRETSSPVKEWEVFGRADDKGKIVSMIFNDANHHDGLYVYAICGMGGLGKITIAQLVCNDENVAKAFDLRIWVCVSYDFDVKRLTKAIVESIEGGSCDILELDPLQLCLVEKLARRRFLLVLDYVWNEYHDKWDRLHEALRYGGAFGMGTNEGNPNLETIGSKIEQRCGGVPLAIKATGSILCFKSLESEWLHVRDSEIWDLEDEASRILAVLRLCHEQGRVDRTMDGTWIYSFPPLDLHDTGCEIFFELTWRPLFQDIDEDIHGTVTCKMHDLILDLVMSIRRYEICVIDSNKRLKLPKTDRLLFIHTSNSPTNIVDLSKLQPLRSLILDRDLVFRSASNISNQKYLKVLDFGRRLSNIAFKSLKQLRYFCLHDHRVKTLPESTNSLHNLQTLNLERCRSLKMLPKGMKYLKNQRYLDLRGCDDLISMPVGLGQLSCLRKLSKFIAGKDKGCGIDELNELAIEGELSITGLCNVKNSKEAENANLIKKQNLRSLSLTWQNRESTHHQHINDEKVLNALQPRSSLKKLCITGYQAKENKGDSCALPPSLIATITHIGLKPPPTMPPTPAAGNDSDAVLNDDAIATAALATYEKYEKDNKTTIRASRIADIIVEGMQMREVLQANVLIEKLPKSWSDYRNSLKHKKRKISLKELVGHMKIEEANRIKNKLTNSMSNLSFRVNLVESKFKKIMKRGNQDKKTKPHKATNFKKSGNDKSEGKKLKCYVCGLPDHKAYQCQHRSDHQNENKPHMHVVEEDDEIIVAVVSEVNLVENSERVYTGNSSSTEVLGKGNVLLKLTSDEDPKTFKEAIISIDASFWKSAINDELESIMSNHTWELVNLPKGFKPICNKWVFRKKMRPDGLIQRYKARLDVKGFTQRFGLDYFDTHSPVTKISTIRALFALASIHKLQVHQMDVKTIFLNGDLDEEIYMEQLLGFEAHGMDGKVYRLKKLLYGLKQAPKQWYEKFYKTILSFSFIVNGSDACVYSKMFGTECVIISLYTHNPSGEHWIALKRLLKYLKGTLDWKLEFVGFPAVLEGYCDANWVSDNDETCIARSTMDSEFIAVDLAGQEVEWLRSLLADIPLWGIPTPSVSLLCDS